MKILDRDKFVELFSTHAFATNEACCVNLCVVCELRILSCCEGKWFLQLLLQLLQGHHLVFESILAQTLLHCA